MEFLVSAEVPEKTLSKISKPAYMYMQVFLCKRRVIVLELLDLQDKKPILFAILIMLIA